MLRAYRRLDAHLSAGADDGTPVTGDLSGRRVFAIWLAANLVVTTMLTGTLFVPSVSLSSALWLILAGTVVGALVLVAVGNVGTRTGLPTMALTRASFGVRGSRIPVAANIAVLMGWSWVQAMLAGVTVNYVVQQQTGYSNPALFSVLCEVIVVSLAIFGHAGIAKVEPILAVVILAIMAYLFLDMFGDGFARLNALPRDPDGLSGLGIFDIVVATAVSWTVLSADINRFARTERGGVIGSGLGYIASTVAAMTLGATAIAWLLANGEDAPPFDPTVIVAEFGVPLAGVVFFSVMATNSMAVYGMVTSLVNAEPGRIRFLPAALGLGVVSIAGSAWLALLDKFTSFLTAIGIVFIPVFAIIVVDFYVLRRGRYAASLAEAGARTYWYRGGWNPVAVAVWVVGVAFSSVITYVWVSPVGATVPTFLVSAGLYWVASATVRGRSTAAEEPVAARSS
ncbi:purine-cytosine transporter [Tsukamurella pulmonis]|uniref:NCS1 nucleoside transporter family n=1 Tax=Tsukamurella pulmonis TaxID=47312 RepID=A0A1H1AU37_9ACTN|nr:cytosine permease [Tsukamurella pulmonis]KXO92861.1 purine-cytosine transporter [Tsukamurella pulmonis]SDQ43203.1 NCS1 nucleoside transporter family [Tsukamurella pulmonis]SUP26102.1 cytosine permease [Tsukamurella pulmonis]